MLLASFLSAAQPTDQGEESVLLLLLGGFGGTVFGSPMCEFRENFSSK